MKRTLIITSSILALLLVLGGLWWYLLMNGRPAALDTIPNPFGMFGSNEFTPEPLPEDAESLPTEPSFDTTLRQVTDAQVAGAVFVVRDEVTYIRYVERGTGHIFEFDTATNATVRLTGTTVPRTTRAYWSPFGNRVVLESETSLGGIRIFAGVITTSDDGESVLEGTELAAEADNIAFSESGDQILYTIRSLTGSTGYAYDVQTGEISTRFTSILRDIRVAWEPTLFVFTTPSAHLNGFAYEGTGFVRRAGNLPGLMLTPAREGYALTYVAENGAVYSRSNAGIDMGIAIFPQKCTSDPVELSVLWCGASFEPISGAYPDIWYQGAAAFSDSIWQLDLVSGAAALVSIPSEDVQEDIDVIDMHINETRDALIFINKRDSSLWLQEID